MKRRLLVIFTMLLITTTLVLSCAPAATPTASAPAPQPTTASAPQPQAGGTLRVSSPIPANIGYPADMTSLSAFECMQPALESLFRFDEKFQVAPHLATGYTVSPDAKSITITLRKGVKFHDGTDFNADAVKFNLDIWRTSPRIEVKSVSSIDVVDDYTVRLNMSQFDSFVLSNLAETAGFMISPTAFKANGGKDWAYKNAIGTGPFKVTAYQTTQSITFAKFDGYWQKGKPYLDSIKWQNIPDFTVAGTALQAGEVDVIGVGDLKVASDLKKMGNFNVNAKEARAILFIPDSANKESPWSDIRVRQAAAYAIDSKAMVPAVTFGLGEVTNQIVPQKSVFYDSSIAGYPYNPQKAQELLAAAGYAQGFKTDIYYFAPSPELRCTAFQGYLAKVGITATLQPRDMGPFMDFRMKGWKNGLYDDMLDAAPEREPAKLLSSYISTKSAFFPNVIKPDDYLSTMDQIIKEPNYDARVKLEQQIGKLMIDKYCMIIPQYMQGRPYISSKKVNGHDLEKIWIHQWLPENVWLSK